MEERTKDILVTVVILAFLLTGVVVFLLMVIGPRDATPMTKRIRNILMTVVMLACLLSGAIVLLARLFGGQPDSGMQLPIYCPSKTDDWYGKYAECAEITAARTAVASYPEWMPWYWHYDTYQTAAGPPIIIDDSLNFTEP